MKNKKNKEGQTTGKARGKLSLCMIVKNEEKELPLCVNSVKPALDEIVIVIPDRATTRRKSPGSGSQGRLSLGR
jgi:hypothetical protein